MGMMSEGMGAWELPEGWEWKTLEEIAPADAGQIRPADFPDEEFHYLGLDALQSGGWIEPVPRPVRGTEVRSTCNQFGPQHVLYAKLRPYLNKVVVPSSEGVASTEFVPLTPNQDTISREYLAWFLRSSQFVAYAVKNSTGARMPRVRMSALWEATVPLPPLSEQRRIVARIEALFAELAEARCLHEVIQQDANRLMDAALTEQFSRVESESPGTRRLDEVTQLTNGGTPSRSNPEYYTGNIPWVKTGELNDGFIVDTEEHITQEAINASSAKLLPAGTLLIAMYGQGQTRGRTGILSMRASTNQACCAVLSAPDVFLLTYLQFWFRSMYMELRRQSETRGGNQPNLNARMLKALKPPLPPCDVQYRIVAYLDGVQAQVAALKRAQEAAAAELERLEQAILARAFRGEL